MTYTVGADMLADRSIIDKYNDIDSRNPISNIYHEAWFEQGDIATLPRVIDLNPIVSNSSKYIYDMSHIKLKSINLGYGFAFKNKTTFIKRIDLTINASNLYYWFREKEPEQGNGVAKLRNTYPEMRSYTMGLSANF